MHQCGAGIRGWKVSSHDVKTCLTRDELKTEHVQTVNFRLLNLVEIIVPPEEGNPSLPDADGV